MIHQINSQQQHIYYSDSASITDLQILIHHVMTKKLLTYFSKSYTITSMDDYEVIVPIV